MSIPGLPKDLVEEILCCVPATYLNRLRSTSKKWNRLFKEDWRFTKKHSDKAAKQFVILILTDKFRICPTSVNLHGIVPSVAVKGELSLIDPRYNNSGAQFHISQVFHCDGLLLCSSDDESTIVVWNPCTGQTRWIDAGKRCMTGRSYVLGYYQDKKSCGKSYKILSFYPDSSKDYSEIYEFSSDSWSILDDDIAPGWYIGYSSHSVSLKGNTYWFAIDKTKTHMGIL